MADSKKPTESNPVPQPAAQADDYDLDSALSEQVQTLTWALIDDQIDEADWKELESLLSTDAEARATYVQCVQMHVDLQTHFAGESKTRITLPPEISPVPVFDPPTTAGGGHSAPTDA